MAEGGVYGVDQVEFRIDERAVEIENQHANIREGRRIGI
jgi:hypothetical protein